MTVSTLVKVSDQLLNDLKQVQIEIDQVSQKRLNEYSKFVHEYFEEVLEEGDKIEVTSSKIEFTRPQEEYNYNKELASIRIGYENWRDEEKSKISTSFYSTSDDSDYELRRMILLGKVGQIVLDFKDDILAGWNEIRNRYKKELETLRGREFTIEKERSSISNQIRDIKANEVLDKVESEGIQFEVPEGNSYHKLPSLDVAYDHQIRYVIGLRILGKTKSGKSANIEVTRVVLTWDSKKEEHVTNNVTNIYEKVRMKNIETFLQYNSERISAS